MRSSRIPTSSLAGGQLTLLTGKAQAAIGDQQKDRPRRDRGVGDSRSRDPPDLSSSTPRPTPSRPSSRIASSTTSIGTCASRARARSTAQQYWLIVKEFNALGLPEEMDMAWQESGSIRCRERHERAGWWQFGLPRARVRHARRRSASDDHTDVLKAPGDRAWRIYWPSSVRTFQLAIASYNKGERHAARPARSPSSRAVPQDKRDFWHLYRLKKLPRGTPVRSRSSRPPSSATTRKVRAGVTT